MVSKKSFEYFENLPPPCPGNQSNSVNWTKFKRIIENSINISKKELNYPQISANIANSHFPYSYESMAFCVEDAEESGGGALLGTHVRTIPYIGKYLPPRPETYNVYFFLDLLLDIFINVRVMHVLYHYSKLTYRYIIAKQIGFEWIQNWPDSNVDEAIEKNDYKMHFICALSGPRYQCYAFNRLSDYLKSTQIRH